MTCPHCDYADVRPWERDCPRCGRECGYPNVRRALDPANKQALDRRFQMATNSATARGVAQVFADFVAAASGAQAVMSRKEKVALNLLEDDNALWRAYYEQTGSGLRRPEDTITETERSLADDRLFSQYRNNICFAVLSLNGLAPACYGTCCVTFEETLISHRASVFEENSLTFERRIAFAQPPDGHRASWDDRGQLAGAKLGHRISADTTASEFDGILMSQDSNDRDPDFLEVHIFGALHGTAIAAIKFWPLRNSTDAPFRKQIMSLWNRRKNSRGG